MWVAENFCPILEKLGGRSNKSDDESNDDIAYDGTDEDDHNGNKDERIHIENHRDKSTLTIDALQRSDCGKMSVCVSSSIGADQSSVNICIEDVPDAPIGKPQVYDLGRTSASLSWCGPASSGGKNVTHYSIEARTRQNGQTWDVMVSQCKELTCHILDLKPCTTYQFRVRAVNRHGLGPPSEPTDKVTTFDPFSSPSDYDESDGNNEVFTPSLEYRQ
ncbi:myosin light chain kinase, smooth muscle, partial [Plakobranchus ocellatus]